MDMQLFAAAGVRVVPIENFPHKVAWIEDLDLLVIDAHLTSEERERVVCHYLPAVLSSSP